MIGYTKTLGIGVKFVKEVPKYILWPDYISMLIDVVSDRRRDVPGPMIFLVDEFLLGQDKFMSKLGCLGGDLVEYIDASTEPTTDGIDLIVSRLIKQGFLNPSAIIGVGGGCVLDSVKAV